MTKRTATKTRGKTRSTPRQALDEARSTLLNLPVLNEDTVGQIDTHAVSLGSDFRVPQRVAGQLSQLKVAAVAYDKILRRTREVLEEASNAALLAEVKEGA
jgi:hypothetical protein